MSFRKNLKATIPVPDGYLWARTITCPYCEGRRAAVAQLASWHQTEPAFG